MESIKKREVFRRLAFAVFAFLPCMRLLATPVSTDMAEKAVQSWLHESGRLGMRGLKCIESVKTVSTLNGAAFNVVRLRDGGFVITANDTEIEPIIAFSPDSNFVEASQNPLFVMLDKDLSSRARKQASVVYSSSQAAGTLRLSEPATKWARLTQGASLGGETRFSVDNASPLNGGVSDVRIGPLLETKWSQDEPCFNYYTPHRYPCGCVATATAQIMRYFRYPTGYVSPRTNSCDVQYGTEDVGGGYYRVLYRSELLSMQGGFYDWANMPATVDGGISEVQIEAIGKLTSDVGIACFMSYAEHGSGTGGYMPAPALKNVFGYASALPIVAYGYSFPVDVLKAVLIPNLDAGLPVFASVDGAEGGHAVVADGYGYSSGTLYVHFNIGWGGAGDAWYAPPVVENFTAIDGFVYNVYPTGNDGDVICSGRVLSSNTGLPVAGAKVSVADPELHTRGECTTDANGIYAVIVSAGTHELTAEKSMGRSVRSVTLDACVGTTLIGTSYLATERGSVGNVCGFDFEIETQDTNIVRFDANGGVCDIAAIGRDVGDAYGDMPTATRHGYAFLGWFTAPSDGEEVSASMVVESDITLYAHWQANVYRVVFNANGGTVLETEREREYGSAIGSLPAPWRSGYVFAGWYSEYSGGTLVTAATVVHSDMYCFARWNDSSNPNAEVDDGFVDASGVGSSIESPDFTWQTTTAYPWSVISDTSVAGVSAARSCEMPGSTTSKLRTYVVGPATLHFCYQLRTYGGCFVVACDSETLFEEKDYVASMLWTELTLDIPTGKHIVTFGYTHPSQGYATGWGNGVRLDNVSFSGGKPYLPPTYWIIAFDCGGGYCDEETREVVKGFSVGALPTPVRDGYTFDGWYTSAENGSRIVASTLATGNATYYAHWTAVSAPDPDPSPGPPTPADPETPIDQEPVNPKPVNPAPVDPVPVDPSPGPKPAPEQDEAYELYEVVTGSAPAVASEYNGYLFDAKGSVKGTIQVKVGKPGKNDGKSAVKAAVVLGANKVALKAAGNGKVAISPNGPTEVALVGGERCTVTLGAAGISGTYGAYLIDGARNFFAAKSGGEAANAVLGKWLGSVSVAWDGGSLGVSIAAKGKVKVKGSLANGAKVSAKSTFLVGEEWCAVPVAAPKANLAFTLWLSRDGRTAVVEGLGAGAIAGKPSALAANAAFHVSKTASLWSSISGTVLKDYIPDGVKVASVGGKWVLPKAGKVVYKDGEPDGSKLGDNPSGLKFSYKAKDGAFKGSFKVYAVNGGKAKATTVNVTGVMVGATGYGTATIKGKDSVAVTVK